VSTWPEIRPAWIKRVNNGALLSVIAEVAKGYDMDENLGDTTERIETVLWLSTRGKAGKEWGHAGFPVMAFLEARARNKDAS
jgi:hypothetical protein